MDEEDGARFSPQATRNKSYCNVNGCFSKASKDTTLRFHSFPKYGTEFVVITNESGDLEQIPRRDAWALRLLIDKAAITDNTRVCSLHFKRSDYILPDAPTQKRYLRRDAVPSCNLPLVGSVLIPEDATSNGAANEDQMESCSDSNTANYGYLTTKSIDLDTDINMEGNSEIYRDESDKEYRDGTLVLSRIEIKDEPIESEIKVELHDVEMPPLHYFADPNERATSKTTRPINIVKEESEETEIKLETVDIPDINLSSQSQELWDPASAVRNTAGQRSTILRNVAIQTDDEFNGPKFTDIIKTNRGLNVLTGIPNFSVLNTIIDIVKIASPRLTRARGLRHNIEDRIIMTFMKMKQDLTYGTLSTFFKCKSKRSCKRIILQMLETLSCAMKFAISWPGRDEAFGKLANFSYDLSNIRCIINRIEIDVKKSNDILRRVTTFSRYKRHHSVKFLIAVTRSGFICFLSEAYGGRISHRNLFEESNITKLLDKNDTVMIFKDFPIEDYCQERNIKLVKSLYQRNVEQNSAGYRVQLNVNRRLRRFKIFRRKLTNTLSLRVEQIVTILCAVENLNLLTYGITSSKES